MAKLLQVFSELYEVLSRPHFFHQDPGWDPKGQPKRPTRKMLDRWQDPCKFLANFTKSFQDLTFSTRIQDGTPRDNQKGPKRKLLDNQKNPSEFLLDFRQSFREFIFSTRVQDRIPRHNQRDKKGNCLTGRKTLATFYWNLRNPFRTSLFPPGSRMGSQGAIKGTKKENA